MNQSNRHIPKAHDHFFRMMMSDKRVAREFFESHLPRNMLAVADLNYLELQSSSYIDDIRKESIADMLFKTLIAGHEAYLYLLVDHQSRPDKLMPFRILKYLCNVIEHHLKENNSKRIPLILPIVVYHGRQAWNYSNDIHDLVDAPKELIDQYFLKPFTLLDLNKIEDEDLKQYIWSGVMELTLKHIFARDMLPHFKEMIELLRQMEQADGKNLIEIVLTYILDRGELSNKKTFFNLVKTELTLELGEKIMTIAEQLKLEGKLEVAEQLLAQKIDLALIAKVTGLSLQKIKELVPATN
jgi:recombination-promoting nuclease RpnB